VGATASSTLSRPGALLASAWPARIAWFILPLVAGPGLADALAARSDAVQWVAQIGLWAGWLAGLVATLVPSTVSLTAVRLLAPGALGAVVLAAATAGTWDVSVWAGLAAGLLATLVVFLPTTGDVMINGSAYGPERRMALRPPAALVIGPVQLVWLVVFAGAVTGPLLLAARNWWAGVPLTVVGAVVVVLGGRSLHRLSKRWVVFVPAGFVLVDRFTMSESILLRTRQVAGIGPAPSDPGDAVDLTAGAMGLAVQVSLAERVKLGVRHRSGEVRNTETDRLVFTPSLPGVLLREARERGVPLARA
jgi:hypothetical protein